MLQHYGWLHFWQQGDWVIKVTAMILLFMSVLSWTVILVKTIRFYFLIRSQQRSVDQLRERLVRSAMVAREKYANKANADEIISTVLQSEVSIMGLEVSSGLGVLASVGATAPFIGLFGTHPISNPRARLCQKKQRPSFTLNGR